MLIWKRTILSCGALHLMLMLQVDFSHSSEAEGQPSKEQLTRAPSPR